MSSPSSRLPALDFFELFTPKDIILLALSGGSDSVFLGEMLFRKSFKNVVVAHFNHKLRGGESSYDQKICSKKAKEWKYKFETADWDEPQESEEKARQARYNFLESIRQKHNAKAIFLAHHCDDQIETIFFQFLRGSGIHGLAGMKKWDDARKTFRPLLDISKAEIVHFLQEENISFCQDSTNTDPEAYDRNFLRLKVLPLLRERFPDFQNSLLRNAELFKKLEIFVEREVEKFLGSKTQEASGKQQEDSIEFSRIEFFELPDFLRGEILKEILLSKASTYKQIRELQEFLRTAKSGKEKTLLGAKFQVYGENVFVEFLS